MASPRTVGVNENISTFGDGTRDYTLWSTWESVTDNDLVTAEVSEVLECYADSAVFFTWILFLGAITNESYRRIIRNAPDNYHGGIPGAGVKTHQETSNECVDMREGWCCVQGIELEFDAVSAWGTECVLVTNQARGGEIVDCIIFGHSVGAASGGLTTTISGGDIGDFRIINNLVLGGDDYGFLLSSNNLTHYVFNNTIVGCDVGMQAGSAAGIIVRNNICDGNTSNDFTGTYDTASNNMSSDATAPGTDSRTSQTVTYVDAGSQDYHLSPLDEGALGFGIDLSSDADHPFDQDVDQETITTWSIGFDSLVGGGGGGGGSGVAVPHLRRRRR